jgi:16S rRNA (cytosine967-C5)-methyltransferase
MPTSSISPARTAAFDALLRIEQQAAYAGELLHSSRLQALSAADHGLVTELVMGVMRWRSRLDATIVHAASRPLDKLDLEVLTALRLGVYQLQYLSRVPAHAAIHESVELVKRARKRSAAPFANAVLRKIAREPASLPASDAPAELRLAEEFAHPPWLVQRWVERYGQDRARLICEFDQQIPHTAIWFPDPAVEAELRGQGIELEPGRLLSRARIVTTGDITHTPAFRENRLFLQDEASQLIATLLGQGSRLLDCCAAPGGKTAVLASRNPTAEIIAAELHQHRAELLRRRVIAANVQVVTADIISLQLGGSFDRVLADVPCSGTGTLARNPEIKWRLQADDFADLQARQVSILRAALANLAPGGRLVYSTCSLEREENEAVVEEVMSGAQGCELLDIRGELGQLRANGELTWPDLDSLMSGIFLRTLPGTHPCDGFFAAMIERQ